MESDLLERARAAYGRHRWDEAYRAFRDARQLGDLAVDDLVALADAAWWLGHTDEALELSDEAYRRLFDDGVLQQAAQVALEAGFLWSLRGEPTVASGWINRAARLLRDLPECATHGYLLNVEVMAAQARGDVDDAVVLARRMQELGIGHDDPTLATVGLVQEGVLRVRQGRVDDGLGVLDEAMLSVHAGIVSPSWAGNIYCQLMALFVELADYSRARSWTDATERWCDGFTNAAMFLGICRIHRAQLLNLDGDWAAAEEHARRARRDLWDMNVEVVAEAEYQIGELCRWREDHAAAEQAYARAHELGRDPQPGLALLRLVQGRPDTAATALDTALASTPEPLARVPLLGARIEVATVRGDAATAAAAADELTETADTYDTPGLLAIAHHAAGTARLLAGEPGRAIPLLRDAGRRWHDLQARHEVARVRLRLGAALEAAGDREAADRERDLAVATFGELGATYDLRLLDGPDRETGPGGLTPRELGVLRLVATGATNRDVATRLTISERTVERHLSNIFAKLEVSSRTEAAAVAFTHGVATPTR